MACWIRITSRIAALCAAGSLLAAPAHAALAPQTQAPQFTAAAALGGKTFQFRLEDALARGPVVLYFYPKAFTEGCTIEAKAFADASERFTALDATVIGVSSDDIATLERFSVEACRNRFAVAADEDGTVIRAYDAASSFGRNMAARISYVIAPSGEIVFSHESADPRSHITRTLEALEGLKP